MNNFKTADNLIKAQVGTEYDPFVLESLKKDTVTGPPKPTSVYMAKASESDPDVMSEVEKTRFKSKVDTNLTQTDKIDMQPKQVFSKYYGQVYKDMRASLKEDATYERAYNT